MCIRDRVSKHSPLPHWYVTPELSAATPPGVQLVPSASEVPAVHEPPLHSSCLLYTSDAADERSSVDLGGRRIIKKKTNNSQELV